MVLNILFISRSFAWGSFIARNQMNAIGLKQNIKIKLIIIDNNIKTGTLFNCKLQKIKFKYNFGTTNKIFFNCNAK